jgi:DNA-3-methyladenine glycosylase
LEGLTLMRRRRPGRPDAKLASGPGALCLALGIDRSFDRLDLLGDRVWLEEGVAPRGRGAITRGPRVGIDYAGAWAARPWRFWIRGNPHVSRVPGGRAARLRAAAASL